MRVRNTPQPRTYINVHVHTSANKKSNSTPQLTVGRIQAYRYGSYVNVRVPFQLHVPAFTVALRRVTTDTVKPGYNDPSM